jgi:hypothetical protein
MENFYVIKIFNKHTGKRGYILQRGKQILIADEFVVECTQFPEPKDAKKFIKEHGLQKNGISVMILSNEDLIAEGAARKVEKHESMFTAMNLNGDYIFYDNVRQQYYFDNKEVGCCCWNNRLQLSEFIEV